MNQFYSLGREGERLAATYLVGKGYEILSRNYRFLKAEVDLIARKDSILVIVEVKTRSVDFYEDLSLAISNKKKRLLIRAADHYIQQKELDLEVRFDIITLIRGKKGFKIEHIQDAFYHF